MATSEANGRQSRGHNRGADGETFARWYRLYHERILAQCARTLGERATAEDMAQETLLRAWLNRDRIREADLGGWLTIVARNLCTSHIRRCGRSVPTETLPEAPDDTWDPLDRVERRETQRAVCRAMKQIGDRHRRLLLRQLGGADYDELGAEFGLTPGGTRAVLFRARKVLRERLVALGEGLGAWLLGGKVRIRKAQLRLREASFGAEGALAPALNAGLSLGIALAATFSGGHGVAGGHSKAFHSSPRNVAFPAASVRVDSFGVPAHHPEPSVGSIAGAGSGSKKPPVSADVGTAGRPSADVQTEAPNNPATGPDTKFGIGLFFDDRRGPVSGPLMDAYAMACDHSSVCEHIEDDV